MEKLKSRKFWIAIALMAYGAIMGIRSLNIENEMIVTIICVVAAIAIGIAYIFAEALVDTEKVAADGSIIVEEEIETEESDEEEEVG